jgi:hypothetical protein
MEEVWRSNLSSALYQAIKLTTEQEAKKGYTGPSAMLAGFIELKKKVDRGEVSTIYIKD